MQVVAKAFAYVTHDSKLLVFRHVDHPEAGIQVPAGTIEEGESPADAVMREAVEETGLTDLVLQRRLGTCDYDMSAFGRSEIQRRHFFHLTLPGSAPERWLHEERHRAGGGPPIAFELFWSSAADASVLIAGHGAFVGHLVESRILRW